MKNNKMVNAQQQQQLTAETIAKWEGAIKEKHNKISNTDTPKYYVKDKGGMDYVEEGYMRHVLNENYPLWNWDIVKYEFLGDAWIVVHGKLSIVDGGAPRHFDAVAAHRIQKKRGSDEYVDIGNDIKAANSDCFKVAMNRLCNISDDIYRKKIEDISLSEEQENEIHEYVKQLGTLGEKQTIDKITKGIEDKTINRKNFNATIKRLKSLVEKGDK